MSPADTDSLRVLYVESRRQLYTYAVSITGNRESAEDAIHAAFQNLLRRDQLPADLRPYLFRSVRNAALDALRRSKVRTDSMFELSAATGPAAPGTPAAAQPAEVERWLQQLSSDERETIVLKIYGDLSFHEIAELRQIPLPTVASWYRRGLEKLKTFLTADIP